MKRVQLKVARIGNSRGVRLPAPTLARYRIGETVLMEEHPDGILLRPRRLANNKLSWDETARAMAAEQEDWTDWELTSADGLESLPWKALQVAERSPKYALHGSPKRRSPKR